MTTEAFEVLDALGGLCRLVRRTPTLDGTVPVRVVQGCVPLLEGNAFGVQIELTRPARVTRTLGRLSIAFDEASLVKRLASGALPRLTAQGFLPPAQARALDRVVWFERGLAHLWTGLLVRPLQDGTGLRVAAAANRRNRDLDVREAWMRGDRLQPLVVSFRVVGREARLEGEIACLSVHPAAAEVRACELADERSVGERHAAFFDASYFEEKRTRVTGRYRHLVKGEGAPRDLTPGRLDLVGVGPGRRDVVPDSASGPAHAVFHNAVGFEARYDGHTLVITPDRAALAQGGAAVERTWAEVYGDEAVARDQRALWYLTKYFTPHPPGEPHFFVKPWAFVRTPPGWSTLVDGMHGPAFDVLRGVVSTDVFHATPAVFALHGSGVPVRVPAGVALARLYPVPRWTLSAGWRTLRWADGGR